MSLTQRVIHKVNQLRRATADEVAALIPDKTPEQVRHALANAAYRMKVKVEKGVNHGARRGLERATYVSCAPEPQNNKETL